MAWVAVDYNETEAIYWERPKRNKRIKGFVAKYDIIVLPRGSIKKLIGRELTWGNEPVELKETQ